MPFSLINILGSFQALINKTLVQYFDNIIVAYLDDIVIYSNMFEEHIKYI
jgi:hypothetical protein